MIPDGILDGHTVVWLPGPRCLVDVTAEQYCGIAALRGGPVVAEAPGTDDPARITV